MFKFDVRYTIDLYYDYYKDTLVKTKIKRDLIFCVLFIGVAIYWWVDKTEGTSGNLLPIFASIMGVLFPLLNFVSLPSLKKQLKSRQADIDRTHIIVTFNDDEVIYENLTTPKADEKPVEEVKETQPEESKPEEENKEEVKEEAPAEEEAPKEETPVEEKKEEENPNIFNLKYDNFAFVKEINSSFIFYLDRQTIIILPKESFVEGSSLEDFKAFVLTKLPKKCRFLKAKKEKTQD